MKSGDTEPITAGSPISGIPWVGATNTGSYDTFLVTNMTATEAMLKGNKLTGRIKPLKGDGEVQ